MLLIFRFVRGGMWKARDWRRGWWELGLSIRIPSLVNKWWGREGGRWATQGRCFKCACGPRQWQHEGIMMYCPLITTINISCWNPSNGYANKHFGVPIRDTIFKVRPPTTPLTSIGTHWNQNRNEADQSLKGFQTLELAFCILHCDKNTNLQNIVYCLVSNYGVCLSSTGYHLCR